MHVIIKL